MRTSKSWIYNRLEKPIANVRKNQEFHMCSSSLTTKVTSLTAAVLIDQID